MLKFLVVQGLYTIRCYPKFKCKHKNRKSYTTNNQKGSITLRNGYLKLPKLADLVKVKQYRQIPKDYTIKSVIISQTPSGRYYASILCEYENQVRTVKPKTFLELDFSMKKLYIASNETSAKSPRYFRKSQEKLAREQRNYK